MHEMIRGLDGIIKVREWPNYIDPTSETDWREWWPGLTEREKDRLNAPLIDEDGKEVEFVHNLLTNLGIGAVIRNIMLGTQGQLFPLAQILSPGTGAITGVQRTDTAVAGDAFVGTARHTFNTFVLTGNQGDLGINYLSTDAVGNWTNIGIYGYRYSDATNATTTAGSGQLDTHSMFSYNKVSQAITVDYIFIIAN